MKLERSIAAFARARRVIAGGVNSPVRALGAVGLSPVFMKSGSGAMLYDLDGHEYIDYVMSWGALLLGHAHPAGRPRDRQRRRARHVVRHADRSRERTGRTDRLRWCRRIERLRFVSSGTEATMSAVRLARGFTRRAKIVKFAGCYHGHGDSFLIAAGSGALTHGVPDSPGVTEGTAGDTIVASVQRRRRRRSGLRRASACESRPSSSSRTPGNMGLVLPRAGYLTRLARALQRGAARS